jgi:hypothetical protein
MVGVLTDVAVGAEVAVGGTGVNVAVGNGVAVGADVGVVASGAAHEASAKSVAIQSELGFMAAPESSVIGDL